MKRLILSALAVVAMVNCSKTDPDTANGDASNSITFGSSIDAATKRTDLSTGFDNGEKISVYGYRIDAAAPTIDFTANLFLSPAEFIFDGTKFASANTAAVWHVGKAHNFFAYYPTTLTPTNSATGATAPLTVVAATGIDAANDVMVAKAETPIYDGTKQNVELKFGHVLSKVRFKIKKERDLAPNATLTKIEFKMKSNAGTVNLATGAVTNAAGSVTMSKDLTATPLIVSSTTAADVSGNWMVLPQDEISDMILTIDGVQMKVTNTNSTITTEVGKITSVTITVRATGITFESSIDPWGETDKDTGDLEPVLPPIIEYGKPPFAAKGAVANGATTASYNDLHGVDNNGTSQASASDAYANEKPYYKFEIAQTNAYDGDGARTWMDLQGDAADHHDNICVQTHGEGWRMPRLSELRLIYENKVALDEAGYGFADQRYWSTTHRSNQAYEMNLLDATTAADAGSSTYTDVRVRCIRELPAPPSTPTILEHGKPPYTETGGMTATAFSHNKKHGAGEITNGAYQTNSGSALSNEKPYYKFEIAKTDAYIGTENTKDWTALQGDDADHGDNICVQEHGAGWRIPRLSEMVLIFSNVNTLNNSGNGFTNLAPVNYWSATESSDAISWVVSLGNGYCDGNSKTTKSVYVRCIREFPAPAPPIIEFGKPPYAEKGIITDATTASYDAWYGNVAGNHNGAYQADAVAVIANEKPYYKFEVAKTNAFIFSDGNMTWSQSQGSAADRVDNICEIKHGEGWRLPRATELLLIQANMNSLAGSSDDFEYFLPGDPYWSSTEASPSEAWTLILGNNAIQKFDITQDYLGVRCIREVAP